MKTLTVVLVVIMGVVMVGFSATIIYDWKCPGKPASIMYDYVNPFFLSSALFLLPTASLDFSPIRLIGAFFLLIGYVLSLL